ncbi:sulfatase [Candidatus Hydrogenedentota bacterium]
MRIIFFDIDCLRPDHLGCYGYDRPTSPAIDSIAEQGIRFENYFCADSPCLPSRVGMMSGRFGTNNGVVSNVGPGSGFRIKANNYVGPRPENEMFMRQLRRGGMNTISFSNFADRHNVWWYMCGWTEFHTPNLKGGNETAPEVTEPVMHWLKNNATRDDYFLHINYWDTHRIYKMEESWADRFKDSPVTVPWPDDEAIEKHQSIEGPFTAQRQFKNGKSIVPLMPDGVSNRKDFEHMITGYDASIAYVDHHVQLVLDELESQGVLEDAIIIVSSDHGDAFGEHGIYSDHVNADNCIHNIPLIIKWPGVAPENATCDSLLYNVDVAPTLCDLLGFDIPEDWDGESFASNVKGEAGLERDYLVWGHALYTVQRGVRTKDHLMIRTYDDMGYGTDPVELFDMKNDPYQTTNVRDEQPELMWKMDHYLTEWLHEQYSKPGTMDDPMLSVMRERNINEYKKSDGRPRWHNTSAF